MNQMVFMIFLNISDVNEEDNKWNGVELQEEI